MLSVLTSRLQLIPLTHEQLLLSRHDLLAFEQQMDLAPSSIQYDNNFINDIKDAFNNFWLPNTERYPDLYPWYTNWQIVLKKGRFIIGGIGFDGYPDAYGQTNVGYSISKPYRRNGYVSEALKALLEWGFSYSVLKAVNANTEKNNIASQQVLINAGFNIVGEEKNQVYFKRTKY